MRKASAASDRQRAKSAAAASKAADSGEEGADGGAGGSAAQEDAPAKVGELSEYEKARKEQMEKNRLMMESLGLIAVRSRA